MPRGMALRHETQGTMETALAGLSLEEEELQLQWRCSRARARRANGGNGRRRHFAQTDKGGKREKEGEIPSTQKNEYRQGEL